MIVRWCLKRDIPAILEIERASFSDPWSEEEFRAIISRKNTVAMTVESRELVAGYMIYELHKGHKNIIALAVDPKWRRNGFGTLALAELKRKANRVRPTISVNVNEWNLAAQLFFKANGFSWTATLKDRFDDDQDAYRLEWTAEIMSSIRS